MRLLVAMFNWYKLICLVIFFSKFKDEFCFIITVCGRLCVGFVIALWSFLKFLSDNSYFLLHQPVRMRGYVGYILLCCFEAVLSINLDSLFCQFIFVMLFMVEVRSRKWFSAAFEVLSFKCNWRSSADGINAFSRKLFCSSFRIMPSSFLLFRSQ